jgi:hypothetical protein
MLNWYRAIRLPNSRTLNLAQVIDVPTLIVWGERDVALDSICLNGTERYVRDLTVKRLPGVSHWVQQDAPQVVNGLLQEFLSSAARDLSWTVVLLTGLSTMGRTRVVAPRARAWFRICRFRVTRRAETADP